MKPVRVQPVPWRDGVPTGDWQFCKLITGDGGKEAFCWPALPVGFPGELGPEGFGGGPPQFVKHNAEVG